MDTIKENKDTYVNNAEGITQGQKWIPRKYEKRSIKILYGRIGIQTDRKVNACKSRFSNKLGKESSRRAKESRKEKKVEKEIKVLELDEMCISFKKTFGYGQQQIGKVNSQQDMNQEQERQNILKSYQEKYHTQSQKNMPQTDMKHII